MESRLPSLQLTVAVESVYSMDGYICPLQELVEAAQDVFQDFEGSIQFVVNEAHSVGFIDPGGKGLFCELGLEREVTVVIHFPGKAIGATGGNVLISIVIRTLANLHVCLAIILGNKSIRDTFIIFGRAVMFSTAPTLSFVAAIMSVYKVLSTKEMVCVFDHISREIKLLNQI